MNLFFIRLTPIRQSLTLIGFSFGVLTLSACSAYSFMDSPSSDAQNLAAARACFDRGDFECAQEKYSALSEDTSDSKLADLAFLSLEQEGITLSVLLGSLLTTTGGSAGELITAVANSLTNVADETTRTSLATAYKDAGGISDSASELRGLVRFMTSLALTAEILAETAGNDGEFTIDDLVSDSSTCSQATLSTCTLVSACDAPTGGLTHGTVLDFDSDDADGDLTLGMFHGAVLEMIDSLGDLSSSSSLEDSTTSFANSLTSEWTGNETLARCYRWILISQEIGGSGDE